MDYEGLLSHIPLKNTGREWELARIGSLVEAREKVRRWFKREGDPD